MNTTTAALELKSGDSKSVSNEVYRCFVHCIPSKTVFQLSEPSDDEFRENLDQLKALLKAKKRLTLMREKTLQYTTVAVKSTWKGAKLCEPNGRLRQGNYPVVETWLQQRAAVCGSSSSKGDHSQSGRGNLPADLKIYPASLERARWCKIEICDNLARPEWVMVDKCATFCKIALLNLIWGLCAHQRRRCNTVNSFHTLNLY